ncbi:MAG: hypothetical protein OK404_03305, partial [Thaumarchaeota archaeon]|nr:hypothetical protein [Nitrososphaerota archaeon]
GEPFEFEGEVGHEFPKPDVLASATIADLRVCGLGYRAAFLKHVARAVDQGKVDFTDLASLDYQEARRQLLAKLFGEKVLLGVGPKVADCVLLYSLGQDRAFPIDVWIARELARSYPRLFPRVLRRKLSVQGKARLTLRDYDRVSESARNHFGSYAGYAQQYLYMAARSAG